MPDKLVLKVDIQALRHQGGMSLKEWAGIVHVSKAVLSRIENGTNMQLDTALKIARFLNMSIEEIWTLEDEKDH
jgi:DNA-binding XRE family transcriptional regulator